MIIKFIHQITMVRTVNISGDDNMRSHAYVKVEERINILIYKNNAYVGDELRAFINERLDEINRACDVISLDEEKIQKVQEYFMSQLENIAFMRAYLAKTFRVQSRHGSEVDREAFRQFIYKAVPALKKPETFVYEALGLQDRKNEIVRQIAEVKKEMNQYSGSNKKPILMQFNQAMDDLLRSIPQKTYFEVVAEARDKVKDALRGRNPRKTSIMRV